MAQVSEKTGERAAWTPGPWCIEDPMAPDSLWIVQAGKQTCEWWPIAVCNMPDEEDHLFTGAEVNANARLIAAAPDLLAALEEILCCHDGNQPDALNMPDLDYARRTISTMHQIARAALAKVGRQS